VEVVVLGSVPAVVAAAAAAAADIALSNPSTLVPMAAGADVAHDVADALVEADTVPTAALALTTVEADAAVAVAAV